jgi:TolB-like protein
VLPLENLSADPAQEYFADGMTDELIGELAKIGSVRVISRTSVMQFKGVHKSMPVIAKQLGVDAVIEGTILRAGQKVRITAQLIQARDERHLWSGKYERDLGDVLRLQGEVAQAIASRIQVKLTPQEHAVLARARPVNPQAYEAYLKGTLREAFPGTKGVNAWTKASNSSRRRLHLTPPTLKRMRASPSPTFPSEFSGSAHPERYIPRQRWPP